MPRSYLREGVATSSKQSALDVGDKLRFKSKDHHATTVSRYSPVAHGNELPTDITRSIQRYEHVHILPETTFMHAPLGTVRWMQSDHEALLAVGSADGTPKSDFLAICAAQITREGMQTCLRHKIVHSGKVTDLSPSSDAVCLATSSTDGLIRGLRENDMHRSSSVGLFDIAGFPHSGLRREAAKGVCRLISPSIVGVGASGTIVVADVERCVATDSIARGDAVGFHACCAIDPDGGNEILTAGASGVTGVWDFRAAGRARSPCQFLRHPNPAASSFGVTADSSQSHFVMAGTSVGEIVVWDRRNDEYPINRIKLHDGIVWDARVLTSARPGMILTCGEDAKVWLVDFAAAASRGLIGGPVSTWHTSGEHWRAEVTEADVVNIAASAGTTLGVNSVDAHPESDLFAYVSDSASLIVGTLSPPSRLPT